MKTFHDFLKEQVLEEEGLRDFLNQHGLEDDWKTYRSRPKPIEAPPEQPKGWGMGSDEVMRDLNRIVGEAVSSTPKINRFGIEKIKFEKINEEKTSTGIQLNLEGSGISSARNAEHVKKQLAELQNNSKGPLSKKGISLQILYNKLDVSETVEEATSMDEPAVGLVRKWSFRVICAAVCSMSQHKRAATNGE